MRSTWTHWILGTSPSVKPLSAAFPAHRPAYLEGISFPRGRRGLLVAGQGLSLLPAEKLLEFNFLGQEAQPAPALFSLPCFLDPQKPCSQDWQSLAFSWARYHACPYPLSRVILEEPVRAEDAEVGLGVG